MKGKKEEARRWFLLANRYPNALPDGIPSESFDKADAEKAISLAEKLLIL